MAGKKKYTNKDILSLTQGWQPPFEKYSKEKAHKVIFEKIIGDKYSDGVIPMRPVEQEVQIKAKQFRWQKAAAIILLIISSPFIIHFLGKENYTNSGSVHSKYNLPDGTKLLLAPGATIELNSITWNLQRNTSLTGDAHFDVWPGSTFNIRCAMGSITVKGTQFTVLSSAESMFVHCSEGMVKVTSKYGSDEINAGEYASANDIGSQKGTYNHNGHVLPDDYFNFVDAPVQLVSEQLERLLKKDIVLKIDPKLSYTGTFNASNPAQCLEIFCKAFGATYADNGSGSIVISR
jgi:ferric-dicitrate binding protein FerR (iron transport regulator)